MPVPSKAMIEMGAKAVEDLAYLAPELSAAMKSNRFVESAEEVAKKAGELLGEEAYVLPKTAHRAPFSLRQLLNRADGHELPATVVPTRFIDQDKALSIDILSADQLFSRVAHERRNADLFTTTIVDGEKIRRLHYLNAADAADQTHVTLSQNQRIIGISGLQTNPRDHKMLWVQHVSVEPQHQGNGYASRLVESVYDYALRRSQKVFPSSFSVQGQRLKHIFDRLDSLHPEAAANVPHADL